MTLNKQRILDELGSVMNQLQSADCGCMGKLFSNSNQGGQAAMGTTLPTCGGCRRGCCHGHGYNSYNNGTPSASEPYSMNTNNSMHTGNMNRPCMGHCNPPKLYADTYNYLSANLMKPAVQEVYNDLKTITPANTVMNNPLGTQMGLSQGNVSNTNNPNMNMGQNYDVSGGIMANMSGMDGAAHMNPMEQSQLPMKNIGGMGPQIVNMFVGEGGAKQSNAQRMPDKSDQLVTNTPQPQARMGVSSFNPSLNSNQNQFTTTLNDSEMNQGQYNLNTNNMSSFNQNPRMQYITQSNSSSGANARSPAMELQRNTMQSIIPTGNMKMGNMTANPATQPMATPTTDSYGEHTRGMMKFNEMFPGVMQGGTLGFDPMSIAIQMNPANQQKTAMDTMNKLLNNTPLNRVMDSKSNGQPQNNPNNELQQQRNKLLSGQQLIGQGVPSGQFIRQEISPVQQQLGNRAIPQQQQQVYTAETGAPMSYQQNIYQYPTDSQYQQPEPNEYMADPNIESVKIPQTLQGDEGIRDRNGQIKPPSGNPQSEDLQPHDIVREPILPVDTSKIRSESATKPQYYHYNHLRQPNQILPGRPFSPNNSSHPQTLSPKPLTSKLQNDPLKYSNVKPTISKTSLMGNKPTLRNPSRSQLQHIYNQYKGSQSYTQQSLKSPVQGATFSEGKLNVAHGNVSAPQAPVEKVGGDTVANNQGYNNQIMNKVEQVMGQEGDIPTPNKPQVDNSLDKPMSAIPIRQAKCRNGLQDVLYTSYPSSAAWSFHGKQEYRPLPVNRYHK